jgi:penicillin-binding protein 2
VVCEHYFTRKDGAILRNALKCNGTHGRLDLRGALVHSCNIYFQTLMRGMLEANRFPVFEETLGRFGFGQPTGIEIESGRSGRLDFRNNWYELISSSIGQGRITVSPAQVARAYAGLMTGRLPRLHVVAQVGLQPTPIERTPLGVPEAVLEPIRAALREVPVSGTASRYGLERFGIACKTGTAQRPERHRYNAWIAGFAPARDGRPAIAFAMVVLDTQHHSGDACGPRLHEFFQRFYGERPQ